MSICKKCQQPVRDGVYLNENGYCNICTELYPTLKIQPKPTKLTIRKGNKAQSNTEHNEKGEVKPIPRPTPFNATKGKITIDISKAITGIIALVSGILTAIILGIFLIDHYDLQAYIMILLIYTSIISTYTFFRS